MSKRRYVTTAIDFPNAAPHMGHVLEKILADVYVRWSRLNGYETRFHLGTDENGIKIQQTAKAAGISPKELVDRNAPIFQDMFRKFDVSFDYFIRTADPASHWPTVTALWNRLKDAGFLEKRTYSGLYCTGCERFVTEKDLVDGKCIDHGREPEKVTEENWFFLLSRKQADMDALLDPASGGYKIVPAYRAEETLGFLREGLQDVSFSRSRKTLSWGVPVPGDDDQVMYVWCDNLTSYISSLGFFTDREERQWWDDAEVTHVIGKDIARFHAINWPAMLQAAGVRTPDRLLIHGFLTSEGQKMSKSLGNVVSPEEVLERFSQHPDPLRFFLSHEVPVGRDGDFSWQRIEEMYDAKLRNQLGNLLNRVLVMLKREGSALSTDLGAAWETLGGHWKTYEEAMDAFEFSTAIQTAFRLAEEANVAMQVTEPWKMEGAQKAVALSRFAEVLRHIALMLLPFTPRTSKAIAAQLALPFTDTILDPAFVLTPQLRAWGGCPGWKAVGEPSILFAPLEKKEEQR